jgi:hypothetical protein
MSEKPKICAFRGGDAPAAERWLAAFYALNQTPRGKRLQRLPMIFVGPTKAAAVARAEQWWTDEAEKVAAKRAQIVKMHAARRAAREAEDAAH